MIYSISLNPEITPFNDLPDESRVWIYQSDRLFTPEDLEIITKRSNEFFPAWTSHEKKMEASVEILYGLFIVIAVNEKTAPPSGCGIDKSIKFIQSLESELKASLLNRTNVIYVNQIDDDTERLIICSITEFEEKCKSGIIIKDTLVFNNMVNTLGQL